jgi:hypothetical protein
MTLSPPLSQFVWGAPSGSVPQLPSLAATRSHSHASPPPHSWGRGAALHGWTKNAPHNHLTAPPSVRESVAPPFTVVLPGNRVHANGHKVASLQVSLRCTLGKGLGRVGFETFAKTLWVLLYHLAIIEVIP